MWIRILSCSHKVRPIASNTKSAAPWTSKYTSSTASKPNQVHKYIFADRIDVPTNNMFGKTSRTKSFPLTDRLDPKRLEMLKPMQNVKDIETLWNTND